MRPNIVIMTAVAVVVALVPTVALAQNSNSGGSSRSQAAIDQAKQQAGQSVTSGSDKATQIQNKAESTSLKVRQEVCEQKRTRLQTATSTMYQGAESVKKNLDTAYGRIVGFYDSVQLTVANYQQYIDKIELAKQEAATAMVALRQRENADIDCTDAKTAARLEGDRLAGDAAKTALKQYRTEIVSLISALQAASKEVSNE